MRAVPRPTHRRASPFCRLTANLRPAGRALCLVGLGVAAWPAVAAPSTAPATRPAATATAAPPGRDWPQFLGPNRDGVYAGGDLVAAIPPGAKPPVLWQAEVGEGWSSPVVVDGRVLIHHRLKDEAVLDCLEADTGKKVWSAKLPTDYVDGFGFDAGPRATPAVADGRVVTFGAEGTLAAWDLATGKPLWSVDTVKVYGARKGFFGLAPSPVVEGDRVIATIGGTTVPDFPLAVPTVVAFDVRTGAINWPNGTVAHAEAGYSSPTVATLGGERRVVAVDRAELLLLRAADQDGRVVAAPFPFRSRQNASVNAATPLVVGDEIFVSAAYDVGAKLLKFEPTGGGKGGEGKLRVVWANDESMSNHYATCVVRDGMLYGFHGRQDQPPGPELRCVEWATGKVRWSVPDLGAGTVTLAGDTLLVLTEKGVLILAAATPEGFKELGKAQILGFDTRAYPAIAGGKLYARGKDKLVCVDLRKAGEGKR